MEKKIYTTPLNLPRSRRRDNWRGLTSVKAGVINPIAFFPLLREDAIRGMIDVQVRMAEAVETIINPIHVKLAAYLVPKSALARFDGSMETLNRSYMGQTLPGGGVAPAWDIQETFSGDLADDLGHEIYDKLGVHYDAGTPINTDLVESYNRIVSWRRASVSQALPARNPLDSTLAEAFWDEVNFNHIKASFDAAMMEGMIPVELNGQLQVVANPIGGGANGMERQVDVKLRIEDDPGSAALGFKNPVFYAVDGDGTTSGLAGELSTGGGTISLANIALARQTMAFAKMRERYQGIPDSYLIDMLMQGLRVPPEDFREPVLLGMSRAVIGQQQRYATDGDNLSESVTNGLARLGIPINTPAISPGGIVVVTLEIVPARLFERTHDFWLDVKVPETDLPQAMEDFLDPQKVEVTKNKAIDTFHTQPEGVFGYEPLNAKWQRNHARVGGRFKRPYVDGQFVEDRGRIWAIEVEDPSLSSDFYLCPKPFPHDVFAVTTEDPFEVIVIGETSISGLTVFGPGFEEDYDHYEKVLAQIDQDRLVSTPATVSEADSAVVEPGDADEAGS